MGLLPTWRADIPLPVAILYLVAGAILIFAGDPIFRKAPRAYGVVLGGALGVAVGGLTGVPWLIAVGGILGAALGVFAARPFTSFTVILTGGVAGAILLAYPAALTLSESRTPECAAALAGLLVGGMVAARFEDSIRVAIIALCGTMIAGAGLTGLDVASLAISTRNGDLACGPTAVIVRVALLAAGLALQYALRERPAQPSTPSMPQTA
jgi:hypothetical protein